MTLEETANQVRHPPQDFDERINNNNELCSLPICFHVAYILLNGLSRVIIQMINVLTENIQAWMKRRPQTANPIGQFEFESIA